MVKRKSGKKRVTQSLMNLLLYEDLSWNTKDLDNWIKCVR